jgi:hypothetical protein
MQQKICQVSQPKTEPDRINQRLLRYFDLAADALRA